MTQSGHGEEPSARPAREGIVLPSDGGEPLLPGMTGGPVPVSPPAPAPAPAEGQAWGQPWGPGPAQQPWPPAASQEWDPPHQEPPAWNAAGPLPAEGTPAAQGYGADGRPEYGPAPQQPGHAADGRAPAYGTQGHGPGAGGQNPAQGDAYGSGAAPLPPYGSGAVPAAEGATQYLPPVPAGGADEGATQYLPPIPAAPGSVDEGATQYIPPVAPGALPPEVPGGGTAGAGFGEETRYLGRPVPRQAAAAHPDAEATQYLAQGGERQPPAEFDNLFRTGGGEAPAASTQQMPRFPQPPQPQHPQQPQPSYVRPVHDNDEDTGRGRGGRTGSRVPLIAAVGVGIVVLGVGAGAMLGGGGGGKSGGDKTVAASASAAQKGQSAAGDPARQQAVELDKLLADSGSSRASVIAAVAGVRQCDNLGQAASDLRDAAKQRNDLVTRLAQLSVDQLPANAQLTAALNGAWRASAAADNHYAAWADQVGGKKGCRKGHARNTGQAAAGDRESGTASQQKVKAAALWNTIAQKYGLTQRQPTQL
ncbi:hypothetical protein [Streptomyces sp. NPDC006739]|uniref:hypothetical protein n=1 Tax=Streptomyces sp. NPDC006739 TaxID=3364763 RepID=UPI00369B5027